MFSIVSIFDFDQTLTKQHTFSWHGLESYLSDLSPQVIYREGIENAHTNMKGGVLAYLKHDVEHLSAIATYHNNPDFAAGFIAGLLGKELILSKTIYSKTNPITAINYYTVDGTKAPFLISYIPAYHEHFKQRLRMLEGKNDQIMFLRSSLLEERLIEDDTIIDFYDDSDNNFQHAKSLPLINGHLIAARNETFTIIDSFLSELPARTREETPLMVDDELIAEQDETVTSIGHVDCEPLVVAEGSSCSEKHLDLPPPQPISADFFMHIMGSRDAKIIGGVLFIAGLAALTAGILGVVGIMAGIAAVTSVAIGATAAAGGVGLFAYSFFSSRHTPIDVDEEAHVQLLCGAT